MSDMQDLFKKEREEWLEDARQAAYELLLTRYVITIEDVLKVCPRPSYLHHNTNGQVFRDIRFKDVGWRRSMRTISHGRAIKVWTLKPGYQQKVTSVRVYRKRHMEQMA